jgi:transaldolase
VASFFVSRLDTAVDKRLDSRHESGEIDDDTHRRLRGRAAVANARRAYRQFVALLDDPRWTELQAAGAQVQRPLWASTSTKDPTFSPTRYVDELVAPQTVNTMPTATLEAISAAATAWTPAIDLDANAEAADVAYFDELASNGIAYDDVVAQLESDGVASFESSWHTLLEHVKTALG